MPKSILRKQFAPCFTHSLSNCNGNCCCCNSTLTDALLTSSATCRSGDVEMLRVQVPVRNDNVARRDQQVRKRSRDTNGIQDWSWILPEKRSDVLIRTRYS